MTDDLAEFREALREIEHELLTAEMAEHYAAIENGIPYPACSFQLALHKESLQRRRQQIDRRYRGYEDQHDE